MKKFTFSLANNEDDQELRDLIARNIMEGSISVSFRRQPSYFLASKIQGKFQQIVKCTDNSNNKIIGFGGRFISPAFVNKKEQKVGYLADLRIDKDYRRGLLLAKGYAFFKELHKQDKVPFYLTMILSENHNAKNNLLGSRCNLPIYHPLGKLHTPALCIDFPKKAINHKGIEYIKGNQNNINDVFEFIRNSMSQKQFAPLYFVEDLHNGRLNGLKMEDFYIAVKQSKIVGVIAAWDQSSFRQTIVENYSKKLKAIKVIYGLLSMFLPIKSLPNLGSQISYFYASLIAIKDNDVDIFKGLLRNLYRDRYKKKWHYFICSLHESDPLIKALQDYTTIDISGDLYCVYYQEDQAIINDFEKLIPYIEAATL
jgi:hypothetical protein